VEAAVARRCAQVLGELTQALGEVATLAELEAMLAGLSRGLSSRACRVPDRIAGQRGGRAQ
jgi:hypothetical protein